MPLHPYLISTNTARGAMTRHQAIPGGDLRAFELVGVQQTDGGVLVCTHRPGEVPPVPSLDES